MHTQPDKLLMVLVDSGTFTVYDEVEVSLPASGSGELQGVSNGASARYDPQLDGGAGGWTILAPETLTPDFNSPIRRINVNAAWTVLDYETALDTPPASGSTWGYAMAMEAVLASGCRVMVVRYRDLDNPPAGDDGEIHLYVLRENGDIVDGPHVIATLANRPT